MGRKLENLQLDKLEDLFDDSFDPRAGERRPATHLNGVGQRDVFGLEPFAPVFNGIPSKTSVSTESAEPTQQELEAAISLIDSRLAEMREGFASGLTFGDDNFELNDVDLLSGNSVVAPNGQK